MEQSSHDSRNQSIALVQPLFTSPRQLILDLLLIVSGSIACAVGVNSILVPQHFATGGITGLALVVHRLVPFLSVGWIYLLVNIPLFILAWMNVGRRFFLYSIIGTISFTVCLALIKIPIHLDDKILCALFAGLMMGIGAGLTLRSSGSQGGLDILSVMMLRRFSISLGNTVLTVNIIVLTMVAVFYSLEAVLYTLIVIYVSSRMLNIVVTGLSKRKAVIIISPHWQAISQEILKDIRRGVTILEGKGGFTGNEEHVLYTVVTVMEISQLKKIIRQFDPDAFVVISNTLEVMNYRIGNQPHW